MHLWSLSHFLTRFYISPYNGDFLWSCLKYAFDHLVIFLTNSLCIPTQESLVIVPNHFSQIFDYPKISPARAFVLYGRIIHYIHYWILKINYPLSQVDHNTIMSQWPLNNDLKFLVNFSLSCWKRPLNSANSPVEHYIVTTDSMNAPPKFLMDFSLSCLNDLGIADSSCVGRYSLPQSKSPMKHHRVMFLCYQSELPDSLFPQWNPRDQVNAPLITQVIID